MKQFYPALLLLFLCLPYNSGARDTLSTSRLLFFKHHLAYVAGFSLPMLSQHAQSANDFKLYGRPGGFTGFRFIANLHPNLGLETGLQVGLTAYGYEFEGSGLQSSKVYIVPFLAIPVLISPRVVVRQRHVLGLHAGAMLQYYVPTASQMRKDSNGELPGGEIFEMDFKVANSNPHLDICLGTSYGKVLKNLNMVRFSLNYILGNQNLIKGSYVYRENDQLKSKGVVTATNTYLSMDLQYVFTRAAKVKKKMDYYHKKLALAVIP